jgi:rubrerythrin
MTDAFNIEEVLEMACRIEVNGGRYYRRAADLVTSPGARELFLELAAMEDDHRQTFDALRADTATRAILLGDQDDLIAQYLQALADGQVFERNASPADTIPPGIAEKDVLFKAIAMEKESIAFYLGIRDAMPASAGRDKVGLIIREEMRHATVLSNRLAGLGRA